MGNLVSRCFELYSIRGEGVKLDNELIIKSFMKICGKSELQIITSVNKQRVSSLIKIVPESEECLKAFMALLKAIIPEDVGISEVNCINPFGD